MEKSDTWKSKSSYIRRNVCVQKMSKGKSLGNIALNHLICPNFVSAFFFSLAAVRYDGVEWRKKH